MALLQPKLNLRVSQKQILTPGLVQMVSVLALNKLELKDMITAEMVENPVLEELESSVPLLDDIAAKEEERERAAQTPEVPVAESAPESESGDSFDQIDMDSFFQEYLDPGYRSRQEWESIEKPSFENFLSRPSTLTDHLTWQLHAMHLRPPVAEAGEVMQGLVDADQGPEPGMCKVDTEIGGDEALGAIDRDVDHEVDQRHKPEFRRHDQDQRQRNRKVNQAVHQERQGPAVLLVLAVRHPGGLEHEIGDDVLESEQQHPANERFNRNRR